MKIKQNVDHHKARRQGQRQQGQRQGQHQAQRHLLYAATTEEVPRLYGQGTSSVVSFVVAMNRVDVVELVVDLVDVNLDIDLVDVDLDADLVDVGLVDVVPAAFSVFGLQLYLCFLPLGKNTRGRKGTLAARQAVDQEWDRTHGYLGKQG